MKKVPPEEKIFIGLIISQIILMLFAIKFLTGAASPPKQITGYLGCKNLPTYIYEENDMIIRQYDRLYYITDEDYELIARCVMSEAGGDTQESQEAVATVILNRYFSPDYPVEIKDIIVPGQFSTADNGPITNEVYMSVARAINFYGSGSCILPYNCYYFRADHYHDFGIPYTHIGNTYFSLSEEATD